MKPKHLTLPFITFATVLVIAGAFGCSDITPGRWLGQIDVPDATGLDVPVDTNVADASDMIESDGSAADVDDAHDSTARDDSPADDNSTDDNSADDNPVDDNSTDEFSADDGLAADALDVPDVLECDECGPDDGNDTVRQCFDSDDECIGKVTPGTCQKPHCDTESGNCVTAPADDGDICGPGSCAAGWWERPDTCQSGGCTGGGGSENCDDGITCTDDGCDKTAGCSHTIRTDYCVIQGQCFLKDESPLADACLVCDPLRDTGDWSPKACLDGLECFDGKCLTPVVMVPAGNYWMGCDGAHDAGCSDGETPLHEIYLPKYFIERTEVTVQAYAECVDEGGCSTPNIDPLGNWDVDGREKHPVNFVTWTKAAAYCAWAGRRLPTEAEWERAARGLDGRRYPWGNQDASCDLAVMDDPAAPGAGCGADTTSEPCTKSPDGDSPTGLCDMAGNVAEWVADWWAEDYYTSSPVSDPTGPASGDYRVVRGGGYVDGGSNLRVARRDPQDVTFISHLVGFRCVLEAP